MPRGHALYPAQPISPKNMWVFMYSDLFSFPPLRRYNRVQGAIMAAYRNPEKLTQTLIITHKLRLFRVFPVRLGNFIDHWKPPGLDITSRGNSLTLKNRRNHEKFLDITSRGYAKIGKIVSKSFSKLRKWWWMFIGEKVRKRNFCPMFAQRPWKSRLFLTLFLLYIIKCILSNIIKFSITSKNKM